MMVFWILGYLVVGFVVAVLAHRAAPFRRGELGAAVVYVLLWPVVALMILPPAVRWCARRLP